MFRASRPCSRPPSAQSAAWAVHSSPVCAISPGRAVRSVFCGGVANSLASIGVTVISRCALSEGLDPIKMNVLTELFVGMPLGSYSASRAWSAEQIADAADDLRTAGLIHAADQDHALTDVGLDYRREIEAPHRCAQSATHRRHRRPRCHHRPAADVVRELYSGRIVPRPTRSSALPADPGLPHPGHIAVRSHCETFSRSTP